LNNVETTKSPEKQELASYKFKQKLSKRTEILKEDKEDTT